MPDNRIGKPLVIEVLDKNDTVVRHSSITTHQSSLRFDHLPAAEYRLRAVIDADTNGRWTPGDYHAGRQPEEMIMFDKTLQLREKWEMEERWTIGHSTAIHKDNGPKIEGLKPGGKLRDRDFSVPIKR